MKGLCGRPKEIEDRKYVMYVCPSVINNVLYNNNKEKNERQSKNGCIYGLWKTERCDPYDFNNYWRTSVMVTMDLNNTCVYMFINRKKTEQEVVTDHIE